LFAVGIHPGQQQKEEYMGYMASRLYGVCGTDDCVATNTQKTKAESGAARRSAEKILSPTGKEAHSRKASVCEI
jgi:hypothetical protein